MFGRHSRVKLLSILTSKSKIGSEDSFVAGLLHDLGKIILSQFLSEEFDVVHDEIIAKDCLFRTAETNKLGLSHEKIGVWLAKKWNLPENLVGAIRFHHAPHMVKGPNQDIVYNTHLGDIIARILNVGNGGDSKIPPINDTVWNDMNLSLEKMDFLIGNVEKELKKANDFLELIHK